MKYWLLVTFFCSFYLHAQVPLKNTLGKTTTHIAAQNGKTTVFYFLSPECPLCQSYSPTIQKLYNTFYKQGIEMVGIISGTDFTNLEIATYKKKYNIPFELWIDEKQLLAQKFNATITPEVVLVDKAGKKLYQGRIDNWAYELGKKRKVITEHDLQDVLQQITNGSAVSFKQTKAVGCYIE